LRISELESLVERSRVRGGGGYYFPRYIGRVGASDVVVLRHPDRLVLTAEREDLDKERHAVVVASLARAGVVQVRETLWEDIHGPDFPPGRKRVGIFAMIGFAMAGLLFAYRYYGSVTVKGFQLRIGLVAPEGRHLWMDSNRRYPLFEDYRATTNEDLIAQRDLDLSQVDTLEKRKDVAFSVTSELFDFFGFQLSRETFDEMVSNELAYVEMACTAGRKRGGSRR
jgi:hypothetical protein